MSYQVIARKYRPQRFSEVVGQEHVTQTLTHAIEQGRIAHAYLFCGPRGTGKTTIARIFAKCLNATGGPKVDFADDDPRALEIAEGRSLDVLEIDGASNRGIEEIRELRDTVKYAPASSKFKIYIIDEVHMLTKEAFNALLKTLEEPPAHVKFMFATTEPEKVLPTILSRCQRFDLRRIPAGLIVKQLALIARQEKIQITEPALYAIARGAEGCMRDAESTLDQLISFCGDKIEEPDVLSMFGLAARTQLVALAQAILNGEVETALRELDDLARNGKDLGRLVGELLNHFRNLLIFQVSKGDRSLIDASDEEAAAFKAQAAAAPPDSLARILEVLTDCESRLRDAISKKILVEVSLLKAVQARNAVSLDAVLKELQQLRATGGDAPTAIAAPAPPPATRTAARPPANDPAVPMLQETPAPPEAPAAGAPAPAVNGSLDELWAALLEAVGRASPFTRSYLLEAHPVSFEKGVLIIGFDPEFANHLELVDNSKNRDLIHTKLRELGHPQAQVKFIRAEAPERPRPPAAQAPASAPASPTAPAAAAAPTPARREKAKPLTLDKDEFKNDPLIKEALEIFRGQIIEVRA
jgi:DNA polymerase-3 subunit gamma/tau